MDSNNNNLIAKCGFYCGSCPVHAKGDCPGCRQAHQPGDCFTYDCTGRQSVPYCGLCPSFPCDDLLTRKKATVLSPEWLAWMRRRKQSQHPRHPRREKT